MEESDDTGVTARHGEPFCQMARKTADLHGTPNLSAEWPYKRQIGKNFFVEVNDDIGISARHGETLPNCWKNG